jgi:hypothetical protein
MDFAPRQLKSGLAWAGESYRFLRIFSFQLLTLLAGPRFTSIAKALLFVF